MTDLVKDLRGRTGAGLSDCARALTWVQQQFGDFDVGSAERYLKLQYAAVAIKGDRNTWLRQQVELYRSKQIGART